MESLVKEMYEEFIMSEACSKYYALIGNNDYEAQDVIWHLKYMEHADLCGKAASTCLNFLKTKNFVLLILDFKDLELYNHINILKSKYYKMGTLV